MIKVTILYEHPKDIKAFETYYAETHLLLAHTMPGVSKMSLTKFIAAPDGSKAAYYRMAELLFSSSEQMQQTMASQEGKATAADLANFATGGVTMLIGEVENILLQ